MQVDVAAVIERTEIQVPKVQKRIAILIPCYNEAVTIAKVVADCKSVIPEAEVYVFDNNSNDDTKAVAGQAGAIVRSEGLQGKGHVVRRMFADVDADYYVMIDGDDTYDLSVLPAMLEKIQREHLDMVVGIRAEEGEGAYRAGHALGNRMFNKVLALFFGRCFTDIFSGYRVFSRRFVKSFPALSTGFEIETELSVHALELRLPTAEVKTHYAARPEGSESKLNTYKDGLKILLKMLTLFKEVRPLAFFSLIFTTLFLSSLALGVPIVEEFLQTGLVPRIPTAILSVGIMVLAFLSLTSGFILDSLSRGRKEMKRLAYLALGAR